MGEQTEPGRKIRGELDRLFDLSLDLMCIAGTDGFFKRINPAFEHLLGYDPENLLSRQFIEFVHPDDVESTLDQVKVLAAGELVVDFQNRYRALDGSWKWLAWRSTPSPDGDLIYAVARDITAVKHNEALMARQAAELARSNADLEQFAYVASHDLAAPLRAVRTLIGFVEDDMPSELPPKVADHLGKLRGRVERLEKLTRDLLLYSRARDENSTLTEVSIEAMVRDLTSMISPPKGLVVRTAGPMPVFVTAAIALEQIMRNLIGNAIKHRDSKSGLVEISVHDTDDCWEFSVADDGSGIPENQRSKIFKRFHRLRSDGVEGTGLGLALIQRIVEGYGGRIWVEEGSLGGSDFRFTWPKVIGSEHADDSDR